MQYFGSARACPYYCRRQSGSTFHAPLLRLAGREETVGLNTSYHGGLAMLLDIQDKTTEKTGTAVAIMDSPILFYDDWLDENMGKMTKSLPSTMT